MTSCLSLCTNISGDKSCSKNATLYCFECNKELCENCGNSAGSWESHPNHTITKITRTGVSEGTGVSEADSNPINELIMQEAEIEPLNEQTDISKDTLRMSTSDKLECENASKEKTEQTSLMNHLAKVQNDQLQSINKEFDSLIKGFDGIKKKFDLFSVDFLYKLKDGKQKLKSRINNTSKSYINDFYSSSKDPKEHTMSSLLNVLQQDDKAVEDFFKLFRSKIEESTSFLDQMILDFKFKSSLIVLNPAESKPTSYPRKLDAIMQQNTKLLKQPFRDSVPQNRYENYNFNLNFHLSNFRSKSITGGNKKEKDCNKDKEKSEKLSSELFSEEARKNTVTETIVLDDEMEEEAEGAKEKKKPKGPEEKEAEREEVVVEESKGNIFDFNGNGEFNTDSIPLAEENLSNMATLDADEIAFNLDNENFPPDVIEVAGNTINSKNQTDTSEKTDKVAFQRKKRDLPMPRRFYTGGPKQKCSYGGGSLKNRSIIDYFSSFKGKKSNEEITDFKASEAFNPNNDHDPNVLAPDESNQEPASKDFQNNKYIFSSNDSLSNNRKERPLLGKKGKKEAISQTIVIKPLKKKEETIDLKLNEERLPFDDVFMSDEEEGTKANANPNTNTNGKTTDLDKTLSSEIEDNDFGLATIPDSIFNTHKDCEKSEDIFQSKENRESKDTDETKRESGEPISQKNAVAILDEFSDQEEFTLNLENEDEVNKSEIDSYMETESLSWCNTSAKDKEDRKEGKKLKEKLDSLIKTYKSSEKASKSKRKRDIDEHLNINYIPSDTSMTASHESAAELSEIGDLLNVNNYKSHLQTLKKLFKDQGFVLPKLSLPSRSLYSFLLEVLIRRKKLLSKCYRKLPLGFPKLKLDLAIELIKSKTCFEKHTCPEMFEENVYRSKYIWNVIFSLDKRLYTILATNFDYFQTLHPNNVRDFINKLK